MKIILLVDISTLGKKNQIIDVKDGYAMNYLIPQKKAVQANCVNLLKQEQINNEEELQSILELKQLQDLANKIQQINLYYQFNLLPNQPQPFVTQKQINNTLFNKHQIELPKNVKFSQKKFFPGEHRVEINLGKKIITYCQIIVKLCSMK